MTISYTKLGILLLRIQGVLLILQAIPGITMTVMLASVEGFSGESSYLIGTFLQPVIGLVIFLCAVPIATRAVAFLDKDKV